MAATTLKLARLNGEAEIFHCNLHCRWCDTDYTWNWKGTPWQHENDTDPSYQKFSKEDYITELPVTAVAEKVLSFNCNRVILTGGEPLLQDTAWQEFMSILLASNSACYFETETNGTLAPSVEFDQLVSQYNVSPKLENSGNDQKKRRRADALEFFAQSSKAWFKFVIASENDLTEVEEIISQHRLPKDRILLMPEGCNETTLQQRRLWLADLCREKNYRFSDRLHIQLWGSKRGI